MSSYKYLRWWDRGVWNFAWGYTSVRDRSSHLLGTVPEGIPQIPNFVHLTAAILKTVSRSITCQLELNISSTRAFSKCKSGESSPRGVHYKQKYMPSVEKAGDGVAHSFNCTRCMADLCLADALVFKVQRSRLKNAKIAKMSKSCLTPNADAYGQIYFKSAYRPQCFNSRSG